MKPFGKALAPSFAVALLATAFTTPSALPQTPSDGTRLRLQRVQGEIEVDGRLTESAWSRLDTLPMVGYRPVGGAPPSERTVFRIGYDDRYLYVGAELYDDPGAVASNTFTRDRWANDDLIEVVIDSYNDNENGVIFSVNPVGTRRDAQVSHDAEFTYGFPINYSWDAFWDAATERTDEGWTAEVRIPFSSLRFQTRDDRVVMGLILTRYIARKNETVTFPAIDPSWNFGMNKPSQAIDVELVGVEPARPVYLSPYVLGGAGRRYAPAAPGAAHVADGSEQFEVGGDLRYALTDNLNLDVTLNPDFAQAEADAQQVNLDRFSLFFPEKRRFFQERAGVFDFQTGRGNRLFHSRRIGIVAGERIPIYGGGRVVGRLGGWDVGALTMQTSEAGATPSENLGVFRTRLQVLNPFSYVGGMLTRRVGGGHSNIAYGLDGTARLGGSTYVVFNWAQSFEEGRGSPASSTGRALIENRSREGLGYQLVAGRAGDRYDPGVGFVQRLDYRELSAELRYGILPGDDSWIQRVGPRIEASYIARDSDGELETAELTAGGQLESDIGLTVNGGVSVTREQLEESFAVGGSDALVPAGSYDFVWGRTFISTPQARPFHASLFARVGQFYDGTITSVSLSPGWRVSPHLLWGVTVEHNEVRFPHRDQRFEANIVRLRGTLSLNRHLSADAFVQYDARNTLLLSNIRMRYNVSEGRDLWVVYDEGRNTIDERGGEVLPDTRNRTLLVKYVHTFAL